MTDYPTPNQHAGRRRSLRLIVLHSTESRCDRARAVAQYLQRESVRASAHWIVGTDAVVSQVAEADTAWAAPGANADAIQIEQCGYARSTDWTTGEGATVVERTAELCAGIHERHGIPLQHLTNEELAAGHSGVVTHAQVSEVYQLSDHTDPGPSYPIEHMLALARGEQDTHTEQETPMITILKTITPWGTEAFVRLHPILGACALSGQAASSAIKAYGYRETEWDWWNLEVRQSWQDHEAFLRSIGQVMTETVDAAAARIIAAAAPEPVTP